MYSVPGNLPAEHTILAMIKNSRLTDPALLPKPTEKTMRRALKRMNKLNRERESEKEKKEEEEAEMILLQMKQSQKE